MMSSMSGPPPPPRPLNAREAVPFGSPAVLREREAERGFYADQASTVYWPSASHRYRRQEGTGPPPSRPSPSWRWLVTASDRPRGGGVEIEDLPEALGVPSKRIVAQDGGDVDGVAPRALVKKRGARCQGIASLALAIFVRKIAGKKRLHQLLDGVLGVKCRR